MKSKKTFRTLILLTAVAMLCSGCRPYKITAESMAPALQKGDHLFVNFGFYKDKKPERGDLVAYEYPPQPQKIFVHRIVGLPGEKLVVENGRVSADGVLIDTPEIPASRVYINREKWEYGQVGQVIEVPEDSYFVLGDNSAFASDSRNWGFVPAENIKGKPVFIYWPLHRFGEIK